MRTIITLAFVCLTTGALFAQAVPLTSPPAGPVPAIDTQDARSLDPAWLSPTPLGPRIGIEASIETTGERAYTPVSLFGPPCDITCTGTPEGEACGADTNGGCNDPCATNFIAVTFGTTYCGTSWADNGTRDTDWYLVTAAAVTTIDISINSEFPSQVTLFEFGATPGDCGALLPLQTVNGDGCTPANLTRTVQSGDYIVLVSVGDAGGAIFDGFPCATGAGNQNDYSLTIDGTSPSTCLSCTGTAELEACGDDTNGGCNATPFAFEPISVSSTPTTVCGTAWADATIQTRDTDWYSFTLASTSIVAWTFEAEFPGVLIIIRDDDPVANPCTTTAQPAIDFSAGCVASSGTATLGAGTYYLFVSVGDELGPIFAGAACADAADYQVTLQTTTTPPCAALCSTAGGGTPEGEPCPAVPNLGDSFNGGCNTAFPNIPNFSAIAPGTTVSGASWADANFRDTDWWRFTAASTGTVDITLSNNLDSAVANDGAVIFVMTDLGNPGMFDLPSAAAGTPACGGGAAIGAAIILGEFVAPTCTSTTFTFNVVGGAEYVVFVSSGLNTGAPIFTGLPCISPPCYTYDLTLGPITSACVQPPTGVCDSDCVSGDLIFNLTAPAGQGYSDIEIEIADVDGVVVGTVNTGAVTAGTTVNPTFAAPAAGFYDVTFTATCTGGGTIQVFCGVYVSQFLPGTTDIVFDGDPGGCTDDAAALAAALTAAGRTVTVVDNAFQFIDDYVCALDADNLWVTMGTFPASFALTPGEGSFLSGGILNGDFNVYLSGGDIWGFDAPTALFDVDGVLGLEIDGNLALDGDDSLLALDGVNGALIDTSPFSQVAYDQDNLNASNFGGDDFNDQLAVDTGNDGPIGSTAEAIFVNGDIGNPYVVGIAKTGPDDTTGKVIDSSFEFGGFGGNQNTLMGLYLAFFGGGGGNEDCANGLDDDGDSLIDCADPDCVGDPACPAFKRGDANVDNSFNIADAIHLLGALFPGGGTPNPLPCEDAADANDDGTRNIADAIAILGAQFGAVIVPLPPPGSSTCGLDPSPADPFGCVSHPCP